MCLLLCNLIFFTFIVANSESNIDFGWVMIFFIGHGNVDDLINTYDGTMTVNEFLEPFAKSASLANKPKLFFLQVRFKCRYSNVLLFKVLTYTSTGLPWT